MSLVRGSTTIAYDLSNDFPAVSCFVSDTNVIPANSIPLIVPYDYDLVVYNDNEGISLSDKQIGKLIPKLEESMLTYVTFDLFNCEVSARIKRDTSSRELSGLDYSENIHIVGVDYQPDDIMDEDYTCQSKSMENFDANSVKCVPVRGAMAVALSEVGEVNAESIKADLLEFIQTGMESDLFLDAHTKLARLEYIGDRSFQVDSVTDVPDFETTRPPDFVAALPGVGTTTESTNQSNNNSAWGIVEIGGMIIGFLVLLLLLLLLAYRKRDKDSKEDDEDTDEEMDVEVIDLQEQDLESNADSVDYSNTTGVNLRPEYRNSSVPGQVSNTIGINPRPEYGNSSRLGQVYSCHDVHQCRSQTCVSCKNQVAFITVNPK